MQTPACNWQPNKPEENKMEQKETKMGQIITSLIRAYRLYLDLNGTKIQSNPLAPPLPKDSNFTLIIFLFSTCISELVFEN